MHLPEELEKLGDGTRPWRLGQYHDGVDDGREGRPCARDNVFYVTGWDSGREGAIGGRAAV